MPIYVATFLISYTSSRSSKVSLSSWTNSEFLIQKLISSSLFVFLYSIYHYTSESYFVSVSFSDGMSHDHDDLLADLLIPIPFQ